MPWSFFIYSSFAHAKLELFYCLPADARQPGYARNLREYSGSLRALRTRSRMQANVISTRAAYHSQYPTDRIYSVACPVSKSGIVSRTSNSNPKNGNGKENQKRLLARRIMMHEQTTYRILASQQKKKQLNPNDIQPKSNRKKP